jgi:sugar phosphate isomerase/epimerase
MLERGQVLGRGKTVSVKPKHGKLEKLLSYKGLQLFMALPVRMASRKLSFLQRYGLGIQLILYDTNWICNYPACKIVELADLLRGAGIGVAAHGPIHDLNPGSLDGVIRDYTRHCYFKTLAICHAVGARSLTLHSGINPLLPPNALGDWLEKSIRTLEPIVDMAEQLHIALRFENMFMPSPEYLIALKEGLGSDIVELCFDIGHFHVYSNRSLNQWLDAVGTDLTEVHLNDNSGADDEHLTLGEGTIDFEECFRALTARNINPQFALEMTSDKFEESLIYLLERDLLAPFAGD